MGTARPPDGPSSRATRGSRSAGGDLLLHPVRLRIVQALLGDRHLTTAELGAELDDVPAASLYRHVGRLADAGVLTVVSERPARGAVERTYALRAGAGLVAEQELAAMHVEDHRRGFMVFVAGLLADFDRYLERGAPDLARDGVGYRHAALYLNDRELRALITDLNAVLAPRLEFRPSRTRTRRMLSTILMPAEPPQGSADSRPGPETPAPRRTRRS